MIDKPTCICRFILIKIDKGDGIMSLFDCINDIQIHCFYNNLTNYKTGDKIKLKTKSYRYPENVMFLETINPGTKPYEKRIHVIKDSIVEKTIEVGDLQYSDFDGIEEIFSDTGKKLNIYNFDDLVKFLYEDCKLQLDLDFLAFHRDGNESALNKRAELEDLFYEKWYI